MAFFKINSNLVSFRVTNRIGRIWYLRKIYFKLITDGMYRIGIGNIIRTQFPFLLKEADLPPSINLELTNNCQIKCTYCTSPLKLRARGFMKEETFDRVLDQLRYHKIRRVRLVGNGEPTFHPRFPEYVRRLKEGGMYVELKTSWQFVRDEVIDAVLESNVNVVRISLDSDQKDEYEKLRVGADFEDLVNNLSKLFEAKKIKNSKTLIMITVMIKPSDLEREKEILAFWQKYCDVVSKQYVIDMDTGENDVFHPDIEEAAFPRCSFPFKELKILWNGIVPLCKYSHIQTGDEIGLQLGNIVSADLHELWNHSIMRSYRQGHRKRSPELMPICKGCMGT